ncbi:MAG: flagellar motor protein MotB [Dysgonomonas sp.]
MKKIIPLFILAVIFGTSCVSKKKYVIAENGRLDALVANNYLQKEFSDSCAVLSACHETTSSLRKQLSDLQKNSQSDISEKDAELKYRAQIIANLQNVIDDQNKRVKTLLSNVENALLGFNSDELTVTQKNGKVYVAMSDKLLFESGSANVDERGEEALAKLADVLNKQNDIDVYIEGHTDNKPIKTAQFKDNWDLSVIRATSVVRILTVNYGVSPLQIIPSGRGEYIPMADNTTPEGRSKNRRTEIIMSPKLDKLMDMLQK